MMHYDAKYILRIEQSNYRVQYSYLAAMEPGGSTDDAGQWRRTLRLDGRFAASGSKQLITAVLFTGGNRQH
jgi:hypothetical protein